MGWRRYLLLALLGLALSAAVAAFQSTPGYMDADYYFAGGLQLASGRGLTEPFLWNYLDDPSGLPHPAFSYWMPLTAFLAALGMVLTGHLAWFAARLPFLLSSALIPPLTAAISYALTSRRDLAMLSGLLAVFSGSYAPYLTTTDSFTPYMLFGALFWLVVGGRWRIVDGQPQIAISQSPASNGSPPTGNRKSEIVNRKSEIVSPFLLGFLAGLMHLTRADGILWLPLAFLAVIFIYSPSSLLSHHAASLTHHSSLITRSFSRITPHVIRLIRSLLGYLLVMLPWFVRNQVTFGTPLAPGGSRALWLTQYDQLFAYPASQLTFASWWRSGLGGILGDRIWALGMNLANTLAVQGNVFLLPLILIGLWQLRRDRRVWLAVLAWGLTFVVMTLVFPLAGARGGYLHSCAALQPFWWAVAPLGLARLIAWGARRRGWREGQAFTVFAAGTVGITILATALVVQGKVIGSVGGEEAWSQERAAYSRLENILDKQGAPSDAVVIVVNPPGYYLASGRPAIAVPDGDVQTVLEVASRYNARYLILEKESLPRALGELYDQPAQWNEFRLLGEEDGARILVIQH
jgi:hypothetical protein